MKTDIGSQLNEISALQNAFDDMMLCTGDESSPEYAEKWKRYLGTPGATLDMMPIGIDRERWKRATVRA